MVYFPDWPQLYIFAGIPQQHFLLMLWNTIFWFLVISRGSLILVWYQGGNVLYHKAWSGSSQCRSAAGVQAGTQHWKTEVSVEIPPAMSVFRQVSSFLTSDLEIGMAHMFGWKPSRDILKPCPKSFSETVVLV